MSNNFWKHFTVNIYQLHQRLSQSFLCGSHVTVVAPMQQNFITTFRITTTILFQHMYGHWSCFSLPSLLTREQKTFHYACYVKKRELRASGNFPTYLCMCGTKHSTQCVQSYWFKFQHKQLHSSHLVFWSKLTALQFILNNIELSQFI